MPGLFAGSDKPDTLSSVLHLRPKLDVKSRRCYRGPGALGVNVSDRSLR